MSTKTNDNTDAQLEQIAQSELGIETLELRGYDRLDFHEVSAAGLRKALRAAFEAGAASAERAS